MDQAALKTEFPENPHGRVEIIHGRVPTAESLQRTHTGMWKFHTAV